MADFWPSTIILSFSLHLNLLLLLLSSADARTTINNLPGFDGDLPFKLETGYISVGQNDDKKLFYYFIESERDAENDPLVLSLTGAIACSGLSPLLFEFGPITFDSSTYGQSLPSLLLNPYSWTKIASIIFIDWPVGAGFSYSTSQQGYHASDSAAPKEIYAFLRRWLLDHPSFMQNHIYIQGESYGGNIASTVAWEISNANERGLLPQMSLQGYFIGSPGVNFLQAMNNRVEYAHNLGLISYEYLKQAETACNGEYVLVDEGNLECQSALQVINKCIEGIDLYHILEPACPESNILLIDKIGSRSSSINMPSSSLKPLCRDMYHAISQDWANNPSVRNALGIHEGTIGEWVRCNWSAALVNDVDNTVEYHMLLAEKGYSGLVYNGDHDMLEPYITNLNWIYSLNLTLDDNWRPWKANGKVAGFTMRFRQGESYLTFATIKGSGHLAAEYTPEECFAMVSRWLSHQPL